MRVRDTLRPDFGEVLRALVVKNDDDHVSGMAIVDSSPGLCYREHYGTSGAFQLEGVSVAGGYVEALDYEPGGDITRAIFDLEPQYRAVAD